MSYFGEAILSQIFDLETYGLPWQIEDLKLKKCGKRDRKFAEIRIPLQNIADTTYLLLSPIKTIKYPPITFKIKCFCL